MTVSEIQLFLFIKKQWTSVITVPTDQLNDYSHKPLKWLRFVAFTIYGRQGNLSETINGSEVDYNADVVSLKERYFYSRDDNPRLVDIFLIDDSTTSTDSSSISSGRWAFRQDVEQRDVTCVVSGASPVYCEASHFIPHSKGDNYMMNLTQLIGDSEGDYLNEIDAPQNGLLVHTSLHTNLGNGWSAFIKTPNFALSVDDIPASPHPVNCPWGRLTLQHFHDVDPIAIAPLFPHNQDARQPVELEDSPPAIIVNFVYGCVVFHKWKSGNIDFLNQFSQDTYYRTRSRAEEENDATVQKKKENDANRTERAKQRSQRYMQWKLENQETSMDEVMDVVMGLWLQNSSPRPKEERKRLSNSSRERVGEWLQSNV